MKLRTMALALALCCGFTIAADAKKVQTNPKIKPRKAPKVKNKATKYKAPKAAKIKPQKIKKIKHANG